MKNVVVKTALKTLLAVIIALIIAFTVASLGFPRSMAGIFEGFGNYSFATGYASLSYSYSGEIEDLARCAEDSIRAANDGNVVKFGDRLIAEEGFEGLCAKKNSELSVQDFDYKQYICGNVAKSKYAKGDKNGAVEVAVNAVKEINGFPKNNALAILAISVAEKGDKDTADKLLAELAGKSPAEGEEGYYEAVKKVLQIN